MLEISIFIITETLLYQFMYKSVRISWKKSDYLKID